jgi:hypothetical protein
VHVSAAVAVFGVAAASRLLTWLRAWQVLLLLVAMSLRCGMRAVWQTKPLRFWQRLFWCELSAVRTAVCKFGLS